jgi:hypothetical protein
MGGWIGNCNACSVLVAASLKPRLLLHVPHGAVRLEKTTGRTDEATCLAPDSAVNIGARNGFWEQ